MSMIIFLSAVSIQNLRVVSNFFKINVAEFHLKDTIRKIKYFQYSVCLHIKPVE